MSLLIQCAVCVCMCVCVCVCVCVCMCVCVWCVCVCVCVCSVCVCVQCVGGCVVRCAVCGWVGGCASVLPRYLKACRPNMPSFLPSFYRSVHLWAFRVFFRRTNDANAQT